MMTAPVLNVQGELRDNEPMSKHTSWRVGGLAETFFVPASVDDLSSFLADLDADTPIFWHGVGSNLLVRDGGIPGVVISATKMLRKLERVGDDRVVAGAGVPCTQLARQCIRWGLGPSEFFAGIPGTVGGALAMNAGAHGGETWERVAAVRSLSFAFIASICAAFTESRIMVTSYFGISVNSSGKFRNFIDCVAIISPLVRMKFCASV